MMRTSSGKCSLYAMQPSLMDNDKMGGSRGEHNNQTAAVETAVLGSVHNEVTTGGGGTIDVGMGMGEGAGRGRDKLS